MIVYTCEDTFEAMMTCIYGRLGFQRRTPEHPTEDRAPRNHGTLL